MAEVFSKLRFDDTEIEKSIKLMLKGMTDVRNAAKEVSKDLQSEFTKAQESATKEHDKANKAQLKAIKDYERAFSRFESTAKKVSIDFLAIDDPKKAILAAKQIALDELDKLALDLREKAKLAGGDLPVDFDVEINLLKDATVKKFDNEIKTLDTRWTRFTRGIVDGIKPVASKVGSIFGFIAKATGIVGGSVAVLSVVTGLAKKSVEAFSKSEEGSKKLKALQDSFSKLKAVGQDFANSIISATLPLIEKVLPFITKGVIVLASHFRGVQAVAIALGTNVVNAFKRVGNSLEIAALKAKNFVGLGTDETRQRVEELQAENEKLKDGIVDVGKAYTDAYKAQYESGTLAAKNAKANTELTDKQRDAIRKLREEYNKLISDFNQNVETANLKLLEIENPLAKIEVAKAIALDAIDDLERELREKAKKSGQKLPVTFEADIQLLKDSAIAEFDAEKTKLEAEIYAKAVQESGLQIPIKIKSTIELVQEQNDIQKSVSEFKDAAGNTLGLKIPERSIKAKVKVDPVITNETEARTSLGEAFARLFPKEDDFKELSRAFYDGLQTINQLAIDTTSRQIEQNNRLIDSIRERLGTAEESLRKEEELQRNGSANNVASKKREIAAIKAEEQRALKENEELNKKRVRQQLIQDGLTQASNLVTAGTNLFARESLSKGAAGIIFATLAIATMLTFFAKLKSQAKGAAEVRAHRGGKLQSYMTGFVNKDTGRTDRFGGKGHQIEGSNVVVGGKEFIVNEVTATKQAPFLEELNQGKYDGLNLKTVIRKKSETERLTELLREDVYLEQNTNTTSKTFGQRSQEFINSFRDEIKYRYDVRADMKELKKLEKKVEKRRNSELVTKKELQKMFEDQSKSIRKAILEERPEYIPITENTIGYLKKTPFLSERILLEKPEPVKPSLAK